LLFQTTSFERIFMSPFDNAASLLSDLVNQVVKKGASAADAMLIDATSLSVGYRLGKVENVERAESGDLGLRVFVGKKQAMVSATDRKPQALNELVDRALAMAQAAPDDAFCGLADPQQIATSWPHLESADTQDPNTETLIALAREAEEAALSIKGVTNSEGADAGTSAAAITLVASNGFAGHYRRTSYSISASVLAGDGTNMERDYDYATRVFFADLPKASSIGQSAAERTVKRIGARKMPTLQAPVIFDPRVSGSLLGSLMGAISGASVARGTSFLKDKLGHQLFPSSINIIDDPFRERGLRSRPFDAEGLLPQQRKIIDKGILTTWLMDLRSARQLNMTSTGNASRSPGGSPSPSASNFYMEAGRLTPRELISDISQGFYVTSLMGMGVNGVTGDYSQAASGFWIEKGEILFPVNEMTIAGNLKDMYCSLSAANDLAFLHGVDAPTLRIEGMTIAGL